MLKLNEYRWEFTWRPLAEGFLGIIIYGFGGNNFGSSSVSIGIGDSSSTSSFEGRFKVELGTLLSLLECLKISSEVLCFLLNC